MEKEEGIHIVFLPFPLQGHISPCLSIARLLGAKGLKCTFIVPQELAPKLGVTPIDQEASVEVVGIPTEVGEPVPVSGYDSVKEAYRVLDSMKQGVEELLGTLASSEKKKPCLISDSFVKWKVPIAKQFNIPRFDLYTGNAHAFSVMLHLPLLISKGFLPPQDFKQIIDCVPGIPPLPVGALPPIALSRPREMMAQISIELPETVGLIFNTWYHMEEQALEAIKMQVPIYPIGRLSLMGNVPAMSLGFWQEERTLDWLDTMPPSSVLYVSFGSLVSMSPLQLAELAEGLAASTHTFLWVLRPNAATHSIWECLPMGFKERIKGNGLVIPWAPQREVLSHPSTGGFLTHCGWNSIIESISLGGLPMICWPQMAEQIFNARLVVDKWKIGLDLTQGGGENGEVKREMVERAVRELMHEEQGREIRRRALQFKESASIAVQAEGSSLEYLEALVQDLKKLASK
eukprot:c909_g1_i1 orf=113-1492(-)